jgi:hypothetical protein
MEGWKYKSRINAQLFSGKEKGDGIYSKTRGGRRRVHGKAVTGCFGINSELTRASHSSA